MTKPLLALAAAAAVLPGVASAIPVLSLQPSAATVAVGDEVSVSVVLSDYRSIDEIVGAYDLNIAYSTSLLTWLSSSIFTAPFAGPSNVVFGFDNTAGRVGADLTSFLSDDELAPYQADPLTLLTFRFSAAVDGAAFLDFGADPDFERMVVGRNFTPLALDYAGTCIAIGTGSCRPVVSVPEPSTLALFGLALAGLGFLGVRRRAADSRVA